MSRVSVTADPLRGDPESPEVQGAARVARLLFPGSKPEPTEWVEWVDVRTPAALDTERRRRVAVSVLTVATALAVSAPILTALCLLILLTRRGI